MKQEKARTKSCKRLPKLLCRFSVEGQKNSSTVRHGSPQAPLGVTILAKLTVLEELLKNKDDRPLNFKEACTYLGYAPSYLYKLTYQNLIPHYKPTGKMIFFSKNEVDQWIFRSSVERRVMSDDASTSLGVTNGSTGNNKDPNQIEMELKSEEEKRKGEDTSTSLSASSEKDSSAGSTTSSTGSEFRLTTGSPGMKKEAEVVIEFPLKSRQKK